MTIAHLCSDPKFCHYCLTERIERVKATAERAVKSAEARVAELEAALKFYAEFTPNLSGTISGEPFVTDAGSVARAALKGEGAT